MKNLHLIIPFKGVGKAKSRLSPSLPHPERQKLSLAMLLDVIDVAVATGSFDGIHVVTPDRDLTLPFKKINVIVEPPPHSLNNAIAHGILLCIKLGAKAVLVLPADIPFIEVSDINAIIEKGENEEEVVVLAESKSGGTNALLLKPPTAILPDFGEDSFKRHILRARAKGVHVETYASPRIKTDIDYPQDLLSVENVKAGPRTALLLEKYRRLFRSGLITLQSL